MNSNELRKGFLDFFASHGHTVVASSPLVPANDPTLLFTNAGMVQFKDTFLGREKRPYSRAASSQRCVRAGGKHNDLENVGYTARHHTFFEMLGNFSFGDYFKAEAIRLAWELIAGKNGLSIPADRLMVTVYHTDDEAFDIWHKAMGLPESRIVRIGDNPGGGSDNFWQMGDTGPCGPCSEIFYDHGSKIPGGPPGSADADGDRWVEIWNLVFMQFDRARDGQLSALPAPSVDTGMGLERVSAVAQGVHDNYQIDLFRHLIAAVAEITGQSNRDSASLKVIADHIRATAFLISDGVMPSNEGRGYVLRRIMRRAIRHGYKLGTTDPFFYRLVEPLAQVMGEAYPELRKKGEPIAEAIRLEEVAFADTLARGMKLLEQAMEQAHGGSIDGATVFKLYDTYGFPIDLTADVARERGLAIDERGYEALMDQQRARARQASGFGADYSRAAVLDLTSEFTGYERVRGPARVQALLVNGEQVASVDAGTEAAVVLDRTPFYAESGGQVGDTGTLAAANSRFRVADTRKLGGVPAHVGVLESGRLVAGDEVDAEIDTARRDAIRRNHSATHLLHAALRRVLGEHVQQKGSLVEPDRLRFDFSHPQPLRAEEITRIEDMVNEEVLANHPALVRLLAYPEAVASGAIALFGEKYGDMVRVLSFGNFSTELCGGTHVQRTGDIGLFKLVAEAAVAAGVRRVEAVTGMGALAHLRGLEETLDGLASSVKASRTDLLERVRQTVERARQLEKDLARANDQLTATRSQELAESAQTIKGVRVLCASLQVADLNALRQSLDQLRDKLGSAVVVLAAVLDGKASLVAGVTPDLTARIKAGDLIKAIAPSIGGKGGGRPDMAQAGGPDIAKLPEALAEASTWIEQHL